MKARVLGTEKVSYTSRKTSLPVSGICLYIAYKDPSIVGEAVDKVFISDNLGIRRDAEAVQPGMTVELDTNLRGGISGVMIIDDGTAGKPAK